MPWTTPSWIEATKLTMMNAVAIGAPTAAAIVAVRPGSRTRLARPSRVAAVCRRMRPAARSTIGAQAPQATMKQVDASATPSWPAIGCHGARAPLRWASQHTPSAPHANTVKAIARFNRTGAAVSSRIWRLDSSAATSMRIARRAGHHAAAAAINVPKTAPRTNGVGVVCTVTGMPTNRVVNELMLAVIGRARKRAPAPPRIPPTSPRTPVSSIVPPMIVRDRPPRAPTTARSWRRSSTERLTVS